MAGFNWFWKAMGSGTTRNQKRSQALTKDATRLTTQLSSLSDADLAATAAIAIGTNGLSDPARFLAVLSIAAERTLGIRPFPAQSQAVLRLLEGDVIQMATGEGKTLVGAMAATGFGLQGHRVHLITVNNYLAARDAAWMRPLVEFFGLTVSAITEDLNPTERRHLYQSDVVYAPVAEIGFDLLRDHQITDPTQAVQTPADVALIDEADSVLIDEALVPLVLAGSQPGHAPTEQITRIVATLTPEQDFHISEDRRTVSLTEAGATRVEQALNIDSLYSEKHIATTLVHVNLALHARTLVTKDIDYLVREGKIHLIDAAKGRIADLRRWPDGLQAAVEIKEGLNVTEGGRILDTITLQALMRRYPLICGMTGTAVEATDQLRQFYGLRVSVIERTLPLARFDEADHIYATNAEKNQAIVTEIAALHATGRPVLVGTHDVAESETLAAALTTEGIAVNVLNAKNDAEEAAIIAQAGELNRVTVSTQMAGRGTDIKLGGSDEHDHDTVTALGGLAVIGTSRYRTARLDNQLRGRAGRQGDPGLSLFFVSLEDDVVVTGGAGESVNARPDSTGRIDSKAIHNFIAHCQRVTEGQLLEIHAQTWKYNQLLADQRDTLSTRRTQLLTTAKAWEELQAAEPERAAELRAQLPTEVLEQAAREIMLFHFDMAWADHLALMDEVRESIHLRAIARETPIDEYHRIAVREFKNLIDRAHIAAVETFRTSLIDAAGVHLSDLGLARPSATWTYMVSDNPLAGKNSAISGIGSIFR